MHKYLLLSTRSFQKFLSRVDAMDTRLPSPSGDPIALITGLKMYTTDPAGQAGQDWERHCHDTGQPGCDLSTTLLQPLGDAAPKIS